MTIETRCPSCGTINEGNRTECRLCGHLLHPSEAGARQCPRCSSTETPAGEDRCISCGWNFGDSRPLPLKEERITTQEDCESSTEAELHTVRSFTVELAAIFMLVAGSMGIFHAVLAALPGTSTDVMSFYEDVIPAGKFLNDLITQYAFVSVLMFAFGLLSIVLSMSAIKKSSYTGALVGAVFGIMSIGFLFGAFFGLMALILLAVSRREFLLECS